MRARATTDSADHLASIEVVGRGVVGRARYGIPAPALVAGFGVSDLVLVDDRFETEVMELEEALLPSLVLTPASHAGVYFEVYGVLEEETLDVSLSSESLDTSLLDRVAGALRLQTKSALRVRWQEGANSVDRITPRFIALDLANLPAGRHKLIVAVQRADGETATATRTVRVQR